jgi:hypothetical protein
MDVTGHLHALALLLPHQARDPCTHWIGRWVGLRTGLDDVEIVYPTGTRPIKNVMKEVLTRHLL